MSRTSLDVTSCAAALLTTLLASIVSAQATAGIATGGSHVCAAMDAGLKCWGNGSSLGLGDSVTRGDASGEMGVNLPYVDLGFTHTFAGTSAPSVGNSHSCSTDENGTSVKCWGTNSSGQLGLGDTATRGDGASEMGANLPAVNIASGATNIRVTSGPGANFSCAMFNSPVQLKCWGQNTYGQLGLGDTSNRGDGASEMGSNLPVVSLNSTVSNYSVAIGENHACAVTAGGVKCWGRNSSGQLGLGDTASRGDGSNEMGSNLPYVNLGTLGAGVTVDKVAAGYNHTCAILSNRKVKCWGDNTYGQLGLGDTTTRGDNAGEMGDSLPYVDLGTGQTAQEIHAGQYHTCAVLDDTTVKCWGRNNSGQLGLGDTNDRGDGANEMGDNLPLLAMNDFYATAMGVGPNYSCVVYGDPWGTVKCWGDNTNGVLGLGDTTSRGGGAVVEDLPSPVIGTNFSLSSSAHACVRSDGTQPKCWGANGGGKLGLGDTAARGDGPNEMYSFLPYVEVGSGFYAQSISAGSGHTCAATSTPTSPYDGTIKCWGLNLSGALGLGDTAARGDGSSEMGDNLPTVDLGVGAWVTKVETSPNDSFSCAMLQTGEVKCWGENAYGMLGLGDTADRGDSAGEMGSNLPAVPLGTGRTARDIAVGGEHACALLDNGTVKCWGNGQFGQLGQGNTTHRGDGASELGDSLPAISLGTGRTAKAITAGYGHTCALLDDNSLKCWGSNSSGQLGLGDTAARGDGSGEMGDSLPTISLGTSRTARIISAGGEHTCAILDNGSVKCWGGNALGSLGLGDTNARGDGANEMGDNLSAVSLGTGRVAVALSSRYYSSCVVLDDQSIKCWGYNASGALGLGDTSNRGDGANEMGDNLPAVQLFEP